MSPDEARALLAEYLEDLEREKADLYSENGLLEDPAYRATMRLWAAVHKLGVDSVFSDERFAETMAELQRREAAGEAPAKIAHAFVVAHRDLVSRRREMERQVRVRLQTTTPDELRLELTAQDGNGRRIYPRIVRDSLAAVLAERAVAAVAAPAGGTLTVPRSRGPRSRSRARSSGSSDSDDLADIRRRCPRCGGALRPLLPSPHWRCDPCAARLWERMVEHAAAEVVAEAESITREAG